MDPRAASLAVAAAAEAGRNPDRWADVAVGVSAALAADTAALIFLGRDGGALVRACPRTDPALHSRYDAEMHAANYLWTRATRLAAGSAANEATLGGRERYHASTIFNEFIRPQQADGIMLLTLTDPAGPVTGILTVGRRPRRGPFEARDIEDGTAIATALARTIVATGAARRLAPAGTLPTVAFLVTPDGRLLGHPPGLDRLTRAGVLAVRQNVVTADLMPGLATALRAAGRDPAGWPPPVGMILGPLETPLGPLRIAVTPGGASAPGAVRLAVEHLPEADPAEALAQRYRLTPRETEIAIGLGTGSTLPEAAAALGIGLTTARTHLVRLFDKTGTRSQLALALLVARHLDGR
jgi:DNA-binding CsgD family transcriptional regulator